MNTTLMVQVAPAAKVAVQVPPARLCEDRRGEGERDASSSGGTGIMQSQGLRCARNSNGGW